jgi:hypothetical protein
MRVTIQFTKDVQAGRNATLVITDINPQPSPCPSEIAFGIPMTVASIIPYLIKKSAYDNSLLMLKSSKAGWKQQKQH